MSKFFITIALLLCAACDFTPRYNLAGIWQVEFSDCSGGEYRPSALPMMVFDFPGNDASARISFISDAPFGIENTPSACEGGGVEFENPNHQILGDALLECNNDHVIAYSADFMFEKVLEEVKGSGVISIVRNDEEAVVCSVNMTREESDSE